MAPVIGPTGELLQGNRPCLLFEEASADEHAESDRLKDEQDRSFARDLNFDQIVAAIAGKREQRELITNVLFSNLRDADTVRYRQEIFQDLADPALFEHVTRFAELMSQVRAHLGQLAKMQYRYHREGWFLDAAAIYCDAVRSFAEAACRGADQIPWPAGLPRLPGLLCCFGRVHDARERDTRPQGGPRQDPLLHPHPRQPGRCEPLPG